jgi:EAL domain-containing protein (putative c-di-GMP-specific phosphodiesterase class I)
MARAYKVQLLGVMAKPPTAAKLVPMVELFRSGTPTREGVEDGFELQEIADAWAHDEFEAWLEPRVHLTTGTVRSLDVSPRWRHSARGVLPSEAFLPSIRARGLNDDFVWLMVQKAAAHCHALQQQGHDLTVSVNLALASLNDPKIAPRVQHIVEAAGLLPRHMVLSVSEAALNTDSAKSLENLARLRVLGFGVAVDEFGNGPMEMEQLSLVAFTEMKIKSSFVSGCHSDANARAGLAASLEIGQRLRLKTIASGVSSKDEWALLREWECDFGQGPFISPPLPPADLPGWLARRSAARISSGERPPVPPNPQ